MRMTNLRFSVLRAATLVCFFGCATDEGGVSSEDISHKAGTDCTSPPRVRVALWGGAPVKPRAAFLAYWLASQPSVEELRLVELDRPGALFERMKRGYQHSVQLCSGARTVRGPAFSAACIEAYALRVQQERDLEHGSQSAELRSSERG